MFFRDVIMICLSGTCVPPDRAVNNPTDANCSQKKFLNCWFTGFKQKYSGRDNIFLIEAWMSCISKLSKSALEVGMSVRRSVSGELMVLTRT